MNNNYNRIYYKFVMNTEPSNRSYATWQYFIQLTNGRSMSLSSFTDGWFWKLIFCNYKSASEIEENRLVLHYTKLIRSESEKWLQIINMTYCRPNLADINNQLELILCMMRKYTASNWWSAPSSSGRTSCSSESVSCALQYQMFLQSK